MKTTSKTTRKTNASCACCMLCRRIIIFFACILIAIGYVLMAGPGSTEEAFIPDIFSARRIVVAPLLCLAGYLLVIVGILWKKNKSAPQ